MYNNKIKQKILAKRDMARCHQNLIDFTREDYKNLFYDQFSGIFFESTKSAILAAELAVNRELQTNRECPLDLFYNIVGLDPGPNIQTKNLIWEVNADCYWVDFDHIYVDYEVSMPYHLIVMIPEPTEVKL